MGKLKYLLLAIICLSIVLTVRAINVKKNPILFKIFQSEGPRLSINQLIGVVPGSFEENYTIDTIKSDSNFQVREYKLNLGHYYGVYYCLLTERGEEFIKAYPATLFGDDKEGVDIKNYHSHLINLKVFNRYINLAAIKEKSTIISEYFFFLSDGYKYSRINSLKDIEILRTKHYDEIADNPLVRQEDLIMDYDHLDFQNYTYAWFQGRGLVRFKFVFGNGSISHVESIWIGDLGMETPYCC